MFQSVNPDDMPGYDFLGPLKDLEPQKPTRQDEYVFFKRTVDGHEILFTATDLRRQSTGIHARIEVYCDRVSLDFDDFNLGRSRERTHLANSCYRNLETLEESYGKDQMLHDMNKFCKEAWPTFVQSSMPVELAGIPDTTTEFLLRPYIIQGGGTILFAPPGRGKSFTGLLMAISIDSGCDTIWPVEINKVLFVNLERSASSIARRIAQVNRALGLDAERPLLTLNARGRSLRDVRDIIQRAVKRDNVDLIFLDSISRAGLGSLTEDTTATSIIDLLNNVAPSWLALAHTPAHSEDKTFGSIHFQAGADVEMQLKSQKKDNLLGVKLTIVKENDIGKTTPITLAYEFGEYGLENVRIADSSEFMSLDKPEDINLNDEIYHILLKTGKADATELAEELQVDRSNIARIFNTDKRFIKVGRNGRRIQYGVAGTV
jgi:hypothetical protein